MKPIKMLGLAALAALMAMAFVGASSAMAEATILCSNDSETTCSEVTHVHETSVGKAKLLSNPTIECNVLFLGDTSNETGEPLEIQGTFTYSSCNNSCTITEENGPAVIQVLKTASELSSVIGEALVKLNCFFGFINCKYNGEGLEGHGLGPLTSSQLNGSVVIEEQETHVEAGGCPETSFLDIETTPLAHTYFGPAEMYCVRYQNTTGNYLLGPSTHECKTFDAARLGFYQLIWARPGLTSGAMVCVRARAPQVYLLVRDSFTGECLEKDGSPVGWYELGEIV